MARCSRSGRGRPHRAAAAAGAKGSTTPEKGSMGGATPVWQRRIRVEQARTSCWRGAAGVVADVRVDLWPPREQRGVLAPEKRSCGGATPARRRQFQVEHDLHRQLMELQCREDRGVEEQHGAAVVGVAGTNFSSPKLSPGRSPQRSVAVTLVSSCSGVAVVTDVLGHCHELSPRSDDGDRYMEQFAVDYSTLASRHYETSTISCPPERVQIIIPFSSTRE